MRRPRLHDALFATIVDERSSVSLVSISAPAGSGKTRLLAAWVQEITVRHPEIVVAWLTCHGTDRDLTPLRRAILRASPPALAEAILTVPILEDEDTGRALSSALGRHDGLVLVVLDDAHEVRGTVLDHSVAGLISSAPGNVRFIVANRGAPPFRIARLRLDGRVHDLRSADLAFTRDEAAAYFQGRRELVGDELDHIMARTEGWAAAFRLLEFLPQDGRSVSEGESRAAADYLLQEIFDDASAEMQDFLVRTAVPEVFSADLAAVLTGRDPRDSLRKLEVSDLLFDHVPGETDIYRYHALLREFLLDQAHRLDAELRSRLERVCSEWFAAHRDYVPAVRHAITSRDQRVLWLLLANYGLRLVLMGHAEVAAQGVEALDVAVQATPAIKMLRGAIEFTLGNTAPAIAVGRVLESAQSTRAGKIFRPSVGAAGLDGTVEYALSAIDVDSSAAEYGEAGVYLRLQRGTAELYAGQIDDAEESAYAAWVAARRATLGGAELHAAAIRCACAVYDHRLDEVVRWADVAESRAAVLGLRSSPALLGTRVWRGWAAYRRGERVGEDEELMAAGRSITDGSDPTQARVVRGLIALFHWDEGQHDPALLATIRRCLMPDRSYPAAPQWGCLGTAVVQRMLLDEGDHDGARATVEAAEALLGPLPDLGVLRGVYHLELGEHSRARAAVGPVASGRLTPRHPVSHITAWLVEASVNASSGSFAAAQAALSRAMRFALESGDIRPFVDFAGVANELLTAGHPRSGALGAFGEVVLRATAGAPSGPPLTLRERDVVAELMSLRTIGEIARDMSLSPNTIKTHLKSIYGKLSVANRREAVAEARTHGIL